MKLLKKPSKYRNTKKVYKGITFDSVREFERYVLLKDQEKRGIVNDVRHHVVFPLIESFIHQWKKIQWISYEADFVYFKDGNMIVEDVKSAITAQNPVYIIKKKLLLKLNPDMDFREFF